MSAAGCRNKPLRESDQMADATRELLTRYDTVRSEVSMLEE